MQFCILMLDTFGEWT